jgi:hypothetical protein
MVWPCASDQPGNGGGDDGDGDGEDGGDVGICDVGTSVSVSGSRAVLWTGLPQLEQNLAPGSSLFPQ